MNIFSFFQKHFIPSFIILCVSFPLIAFCIKVWSISLPEYSKLFQIFSLTIFQSFLSLLLSWAIALLAVQGLLSYFKHPWYFALEWIYLLPFLLPFIATIGGVMNILESFTRFPFGLMPIVLCHGIVYGGAIAVLLSRLMMSKCASLCDWAFVHGIPHRKLFMAILRFSLKRDIQLISLAIFCFCFTSFSIPLVVGGPKWKTVEVFIYEYLKNPNEWPLALGLLLFEILFVFVLSFLIYQPASPLKNLKPISYLSFKPGIIFGILPCFIIFAGLMEGLFYIPEVLKLHSILSSILATSFLSINVGIGIILFFILISLCPSVKYLEKFLIGYAAPSVVLTGFAFLIFFDGQVYFSWISGLIILFLPGLYRCAAEPLLKSLQNQINTAQTLGASLWSIFQKVIWPQCSHQFFLLAGMAGFWACGDFAFTMMTSQGESNLAILAQQLLGQYRIEQGLAVIWLILFFGSLCFSFFGALTFLSKKLR